MAKGFDQHRQRSRSLSLFGKNLARRARSRCELCDSRGGPLVSFELPPVPAEPVFERCLMVCDTCARELGGDDIPNTERWRCLNNSAWSEIAAVQAAAVLVLRRLSNDTPWAGELLEQLYLESDTRELLGDPEEAEKGSSDEQP